MLIPLFEELRDCRTVLLAGAGGGFDIFAGLPLYHQLRSQGVTVHLANLTFSDFHVLEAEKPVPALAKVTPATRASSQQYFPELHLSRWLSDQFGETPIFLFERTGVAPVIEGYAWLAANLQPDAVILIDGGTDSLMRGDEVGLGTPQEDMASLAATHALKSVDRKFLVCVGFGVDAFHGVCHAHVLASMAALIADDGGRGAWSLTRQSAAFRFYREAVDFVTARMPHHPSIVNTSIVEATLGSFGNYHATKRTTGSELFLNPLMSVYWAFTVEAVVRRNLYLDQLMHTRTFGELTRVIEGYYHSRATPRAWKPILC